MEIIGFEKLYNMKYSCEIVRTMCSWGYVDNRNVRKHHHWDNSLMYFLDISGAKYQENGTIVEIKRGDILYIPKNIYYDTVFIPHSKSYKTGINSYLIDFSIFDEFGKEFILSENIIKLPVDNRKYYEYFDKINTLSLFENKPIMKIMGLFYSMLSDMSNDIRNIGHNPEIFDEVYNSLMFIEENYNQSLSIPDIAYSYNLSESTFRRYFKKTTGLSPVDYIKKIRMERAEALLQSNIYSVKDVAELVGIPDPAYFSKAYKQYYGVSPVNLIKKTK